MSKNTDKIEFVTKVEEISTEDLFEEYYKQTMTPLVDDENHLKRVYHSRFWGTLWAVLFLLSANFLIVLFRYLMYHHPISYAQLFTVTLVAIAVILWPIVFYYKAEKHDLFGTFLKFYGAWQHRKNGQIEIENEIIAPTHDTSVSAHSVSGTYDGVDIELHEVQYQKAIRLKKRQFNHCISRGVMVKAKFNNNIKNKVLLFDKKGFRRKSKFENLINVTDKIFVPVANYFYIFTDDVNFAKDMLSALFFERLLDMKDSFKASNIYVEIQEDYMRIYLQDASLYFDDYDFWKRRVHKNKFVSLNQKMEHTLMAVQLVQVLRDSI